MDVGSNGTETSIYILHLLPLKANEPLHAQEA